MTFADLSPALLTEAVCETLEQLAFAEAIPCPAPALAPSNLLSARLSFFGPLAGALVLRIPAPLAMQLAGDVLGDPGTAADQNVLRDAVGEFVNTIAGSVLRKAGVAGYELGLPEHGAGGAPGPNATWFDVREQKLALEVEANAPARPGSG